MRSLFLATSLLISTTTQAQIGNIPVFVTPASSSPSYVGPIDAAINAQPGITATGAYSFRATFAAYATGSNNSLNMRCKSGASVGSNFDVKVLASGDFDLATAKSNCGTDGSITASIATTVLSITALGSGQVTVGDQITGAGITQPAVILSVGTCISGAVVPPCTFNLNATQTVSSETITANAGSSITKKVNQLTPGTFDIVNASVAQQPWLILYGCGLKTALLPCASTDITATSRMLSASNFTPNASLTSSYSAVANRIAGSNMQPIQQTFAINGLQIPSTLNTWRMVGNAAACNTVTVSDGTWHAVQSVLQAGAGLSVMNVDGAETTGTCTPIGTAAQISAFSGNAGTGSAYQTEAIFWDNVILTASARAAINTNDGYWR